MYLFSFEVHLSFEHQDNDQMLYDKMVDYFSGIARIYDLDIETNSGVTRNMVGDEKLELIVLLSRDLKRLVSFYNLLKILEGSVEIFVGHYEVKSLKYDLK